MGFKRIRQTYARIKNDVLQSFTLKRWRTGYICTIEFGIVALGMNIPWVGVEPYDLDRFSVDTFGGWEYIPSSEESVKQCVLFLIDTIDEKLIPLFERADCCERAFPALVEMKKLFHQNSLIKSSHSEYKQNDENFEERLLYDSNMYYIALKGGNMDFASRYLTHWIDINENDLQRLNLTPELFGSTDEYQLKAKQQRITERIEKLKIQLSMIENNDMTSIEKMIRENEICSCETLSLPRNGKLY